MVPARLLVDLLKKLPGGALAIDATEASVVRLASGEGEYAVNAFPIADFPRLPMPPSSDSVCVDRASFSQALAQVLPIAARDLSRPVYTGILMSVDARKLSLVATDGYRLAVVERDVTGSGGLPPTLIPARALAEVVHLPDEAESICLSVGENTILFEVGDYQVTARRLNGQFQPHEALINTDFAYEAVIDRTLLAEAVARVSVLAQRGKPITLDFQGDSVVVKVTSSDLGQASERIIMESAGPTLAVAFNPSYLADGLHLIDGHAVNVRMNDALRPIVLRGRYGDVTYLVAPIRSPTP